MQKFYDFSPALSALKRALLNQPDQFFHALCFASIKSDLMLEGIPISDKALKHYLNTKGSTIYEEMQRIQAFKGHYLTIQLCMITLLAHNRMFGGHWAALPNLELLGFSSKKIEVLEPLVIKDIDQLNTKFLNTLARIELSHGDISRVSEQAPPDPRHKKQPGSPYYLRVVPLEDIDSALQQLNHDFRIKDASSPPLENAAWHHIELMKIYPFDDGVTSLVSRAWIYCYLFLKGLPPLLFIEEDRQTYFEALTSYRVDKMTEVFYHAMQRFETFTSQFLENTRI